MRVHGENYNGSGERINNIFFLFWKYFSSRSNIINGKSNKNSLETHDHPPDLQSWFSSYPRLQSSTATTSLSARAVGGNGSDVLDPTDLHVGARQRAESGLRARPGSARADAAGSAETDVEGVDAQNFASLRDILGGQHGGIRGSLVSVGFDLHASGDAADGLAPGEIGHVDEGVVEGGVDVGDAEHVHALFHLGAQLDHLLHHFLLHFARGHDSLEVFIEKKVSQF